jgi:hypothetical protein
MEGAIGAINAAPLRSRQIANSAPTVLAEHNPNQVGGVLRAELGHDAGTVHLDGAGTDTKLAPGFLVGEPANDLPEHVALARRQ